MKRTLLCLCALLTFAGNMWAEVGDEFKAALTVTKDGAESTVELDFVILKEYIDSSRGEVQLGLGEQTSEVKASLTGELTIPLSVKNGDSTYEIKVIANEAFANCTGLESVKSSAKLRKIGTRAFSGCTGLSSVDNLLVRSDSISNFAFEYCTGLTSIYCHRGVKFFGANPFAYCSNIETIDVEVGQYNSHAYGDGSDIKNGEPLNIILYYDDYEDIVITGCKNSSLAFEPWPMRIQQYAFAGCTGLTNLELPDCLYDIEQYAFADCVNLTGVKFPKVNMVENNAFENCKSLTSVVLPGTMLNYLSENIFAGCTSLETVVVSEGVAVIYPSMFDGCTSLKTIICYADDASTIASMGGKYSLYSFPMYIDCDNVTLYVPQGCKELYEAADGWKEFSNIVEAEGFDVNVTAAGLATLYIDRPLLIPEDDDLLGVFYAEDTKNDALVLRRINDVIPANTGVIIMANEGTYTFPWRYTEDEYTENIIEGVLEATPVADVKEAKGYRTVLTLGQGKKGSFVGFYKFTGETLAANKAFIGLESDMPEVKLMFEDGVETGIESLNANDNADKGVYDLSGRRVSNPGKGLYIMNGKKVLKK